MGAPWNPYERSEGWSIVIEFETFSLKGKQTHRHTNKMWMIDKVRMMHELSR